MASLSRNSSVTDYANLVREVYSIPNDRYYTLWDMLINIERFTMRGIKGVRKGNIDKTKKNLLIALSWYMSLMNRLHIDVESIVWNRFPYLCSYCGNQPCTCKVEKIISRRNVVPNSSPRPKTIGEYQEMFNKIYPPEGRTQTDAAIHLAEEIGELSETFHVYMGNRDAKELDNIYIESADYFSCVMGIFNSLNINCADELSQMFSNNCHICHNSPCTCNFVSVKEFSS